MKRECQKTGKQPARAAFMPTHEQIAARAYQIYLERGCQHGHDMDDWLQAEYELLQMPVEQLARLKPPKQKAASPSQRSIIQIVRAALY